jgi:type II secretory ATPase GspE/PulE/Tfp pilus assembly ATPase PilB-like protein
MERTRARKDIGQVLVEGAFLKPQDLLRAQEKARDQGRKLLDVLLQDNLISAETLATVLSFQFNVPVIDLRQYEIEAQAVALVPEEVAREHRVLPLKVEGDVLTVAMEDPSDVGTLDTLAALSSKRLRVVIPLHGGVEEAIRTHYRLAQKIEREISQVVAEPQAPAGPRLVVSEPGPVGEAIAQAPIVRAVDMILTQAVKDRASDVHIEPEEDGIRVRYRIDGILHQVATLPMGTHSALISRIKVMANMNIAERRRPQDGQFSATIAERPIDFRVATAETAHGEMVVLRVLDKSLGLLQLSQVGMAPGVQESHRRILDSPFGMVLVSGPTGSGKTTTLYASIGELNPDERNIMTIEDPIEYHFKHINQIQVNRQAEITFAAGLRAIMRLDPDIMLVGEIRDRETATVAVQAALTGHLVLTSIHANDAVAAIVRLIDLGVEPFLVTSAVIASVSQRLVRKVCPYCRTIEGVSAAEAAAYQQEMQEVRTDFYIGRGCNFCSRTGYLGRTGVFEMLPLTDPVRQLVNRQAPAAEIKAQAVREGMVTLRRDGMLKARDGITTPGEVLRHVFLIG